jgi:hypothetical protein
MIVPLRWNDENKKNIANFIKTGWTVNTTCSDRGIYDRQQKNSAKSAVNGRYLYQHYATCNSGQHLMMIIGSGYFLGQNLSRTSALK